LAKYHNDNEKIGLNLKQKKFQVEKLQQESIELNKTFDDLHTLEKEKKEVAILIHGSKSEILDSVQSHQHSKILELERSIREAEIVLSKRKANLQKMAEVLSCNLNRIVVDTISQHRLEKIPLANI
jgi:hypothetical protein